MTRLESRLVRAIQWAIGILLVLTGMLATVPAHALEATCIEASRYKYLYRIFDNDRARFAAFFGADVQRLPPPEACRAVLLTGTIDKPSREGGSTDFDRLLEAVEAGGGWLSTLYLASPGGNVGMGLRLANSRGCSGSTPMRWTGRRSTMSRIS